MKPLFKAVAIASVLMTAVPVAASAAPWQSINQRQANLEQRIDQGVRSGALNGPEASRMRNQFRDLNRLEAQYRRSGGRLTANERADLDRRFDRLSERLFAQKHDNQTRRY